MDSQARLTPGSVETDNQHPEQALVSNTVLASEPKRHNKDRQIKEGSAEMDVDYYDTEPSISDSEHETDIALMGIKPLASKSSKATPSASMTASKPTAASTECPSAGTQPTSRPQAYSFEPGNLTGHKLEEVKLSPPATPQPMEDDDWDFMEDRDDDAAVEDGSEDWEEIESKVFDHATNTFKDIPSVVYEDESFRQTLAKAMDTYTKKCTPSYDTKCKIYSAMYLLKTVGEFGYLCVKEPLVDWADQMALNLLEMPVDEASAAVIAELLSFLPERTKLAYHRLRGVSGLSPLFLDEASLNTRPILSFPTDRSPTDEAFIKDLLAGTPMKKLSFHEIPARDDTQMDVMGPMPGLKLVKENPVVLNPSPQNPEQLNSFQHQPTISKPKQAEPLANSQKPVNQQTEDEEAAERKHSFKAEIMELARTRALEQQKRAAQTQVSKQDPGLVNLLKRTTLSRSASQHTKNPPPKAISKPSTRSTCKPAPWIVAKTTTAGPLPSPPSNPITPSDLDQSSTKMTQTTTSMSTKSTENETKLLAPRSNTAINTNTRPPMTQFGKDVSPKTELKPAITRPDIEFLSSSPYISMDHEDEEEL